MPLQHRTTPLPLLALCTSLCACAPLHESTAGLPWQDAWGDRGPQVLARDHAMCERLVEQRRSLLPGCMQARGWTISG